MISSSQVVVAGHICLDIIPEFSDGDVLPSPGQLVQVGPAILSTGGPVSNTGLALHHLGIETRLMGKVGNDAFGHSIIDLIKSREENLVDGIIISKEDPTSYSVVLNLPNADRSFLHCPGANDTFSSSDLRQDVIAQTQLFHFGYPPLMAQMYSNEGKDLEKMFSEVKLLGVTTSLDLVMVKPNSQAGQANWEKILQRTLPFVDIFIPSIEELMILLHIDPDVAQYLPLEKRISSSQVDFLRRLADRLLDWGAGVVCFKLGKAGMYLRSANQERLAKFGKGAPAKLLNWENREIWSPAFVIDKYCGSTGAGDSAIAGFISALLRKESPESTLMFACGVGACNVEAPDALSGLRTWEETTDRIGEGWQRTHPIFEDHEWYLDSTSQCWLGPYDHKTE